MRFVLGGRRYTIESIDPEMDEAFVNLHSAYLGNQPLNWDKFQRNAIDFFDQNYTEHKLTGGYFRNFTIIWQRYLNEGLWDQAESIWEVALEPAIEWELTSPGKRIHKGGPYYFWGMTAIQRGDLDRGYALMHQALEEDVLTHGKKNPDTPAFAFASLNYEKVDQAFREWVLMEAHFLNSRIDEFVSKHGHIFSLSDFKTKFLQNPPTIEAIYLLAYTIARLIRLTTLPDYLLSSPFAGQLFQNLLFDLVQVIDVTIANKNTSKWQMIDHIYFLSGKARQRITINQLRRVNSRFLTGFDAEVRDILAGSFRLDDGTAPTRLQSDLLVVYALRNRGAHDVSSAPVFWQEFNQLQSAVFNILFLAVETLYI